MTHPEKPKQLKYLALPLILGASQLQGCNACKTETNIVAVEPHDEEEVFDHNWGRYLGLSAMPDGTPALSYYDQTKTALGFALGSQGEDSEGNPVWKWSHEEVDGYADETGLDIGDRGQFSSLQIAADGTAWIAYQDKTNGSLRYATRDSEGLWTSGIADVGGGTSPDAGLWASLALDASGAPVIAHYDAGQGHLRIAHYLGAAFSGEVIDEGEDVQTGGEDTGTVGETIDANVGQFASLVIVGAVEYIAYYDAAAGSLKLAWGTSGAYSTETIDDSGDVGQWPDLTVVDGVIHITYQDVENQDLLYAWGEPGSWSTEQVDTDALRGADSEVFQYGNYIATIYHDAYNNDLRFAWRSESGWQLENLTEDEGAYGFYNEVIIVDETTYVACYLRPDEAVWFNALD
jgi:hypothetical protein